MLSHYDFCTKVQPSDEIYLIYFVVAMVTPRLEAGSLEEC